MKQYENRIVRIRETKKETAQNMPEMKQPNNEIKRMQELAGIGIDSVNESETIYEWGDDGNCYRIDDEGNQDRVNESYCQRYAGQGVQEGDELEEDAVDYAWIPAAAAALGIGATMLKGIVDIMKQDGGKGLDGFLKAVKKYREMYKDTDVATKF